VLPIGGSRLWSMMPRALLTATLLWSVAVTGAAAQTAPAVGSWTAVTAPAGFGASDAEWIKVVGRNGRQFVAAVLRPPGAGPFPVVVVLPGASGLGPAYVAVADEVRRAGFLVVVGCWQAPATRAPAAPGAAQTAVDNTVCSEATPQAEWVVDAAGNSGKELIAAARTLTGARADRVGLYGISRGGHAALWAASTGAGVQAVVTDAPAHRPVITPAPASTLDPLPGLTAPLLMMHGTADPTVPVEQSRDYERAARALGKSITVVYFEGVGHTPTYAPPAPEPEPLAQARRASQADARQRAIAFLRANLFGPSAPAQLPRTGDSPAWLIGLALGLLLVGGWVKAADGRRRPAHGR
jgi:dienelactone hydrolase